MNKEDQKRLVVEIKKELHSHIKQRAAFKNISIKHWIIAAIIEQIKREKETD